MKTISDTIEKINELPIYWDGRLKKELMLISKPELKKFIISEIKEILEGLKGEKRKYGKGDPFKVVGYNQRESELREAIEQIIK